MIWLLRKVFEKHQAIALVFGAQDYGHSVVYGLDKIIRFSRDDGKAFHFPAIRFSPHVPQASKSERLTVPEMN